ncbi:Uncharacterised protein [uncultured archaeon]|nr:Uncharacterised protein [uncultured archaeon]
MKLNEILKELNLREVQRWTLFSVVIGIVAGFGAILFYLGLSALSNYALGGIGGYYPPVPGGEPSLFGHPATNIRWFLFLLPAAGGLLAGIIIYTYAPEAEGHGTDAVMPNKKERFPALSLLRTVHATFTAYGSST